MDVYLCGNPLLPEDALPLRLLPRLRRAFPALRFRELDPTEDVPEGVPLLVVDTVQGIAAVTVFRDLDAFLQERRVSLHDADLGFTLRLMQKAGRLGPVTIVGVPQGAPDGEAFAQLRASLAALSGQDRPTSP
ncbi:MAG: hypothetical protein HY369_04090 [Candidatus Aenigmarchaeota archaeon]|nr:hypothetical protein [Candidatus Aenigmarchaeota archaeon]